MVHTGCQPLITGQNPCQQNQALENSKLSCVIFIPVPKSVPATTGS
ncbi:hypothetical protein AB434_2049 [Heyndrickxia coagulans]|uniref:Uncharacterized protein n=1 Tax=Heyndrickxia coagulans TaxID=1398 RepID=A0AAN0T793_HEYCO|nr:hypothetical protein SB48_HM08orf05237 [Heyndrickxia coagulans]AKN54454.1 hypothetical protein AB434_2049 [Heyndrickxia coagulans]